MTRSEKRLRILPATRSSRWPFWKRRKPVNLSVIRWLIANREVLAKCVEIVSKFEAESSLLEKWDIVDEIARVIIPLIEFEDAVEMLWESGDEYEAMSQGVELQALGVDWQMIVNTVVPIIVAILRALTSSQQDD